MKKSIILILVILMVLVAISLFYMANIKSGRSSIALENNFFEGGLLFGLATGIDGLGDKSYNDVQYNGLMTARLKLGIDFIVESPQDITETTEVLQRLIDRGANVIFASGVYYGMSEIDALARYYPEVRFVIIDAFPVQYLPNLSSLHIKQNECSFIAGALAAMKTRTGVVAIIAAEDMMVVNEFIIGFRAGVGYQKPSVKVITEYIDQYDTELSPYANPTIAYRIADHLYSHKDVDIIFHITAASGLGVFNAARENEKYAIGIDNDQDYLQPGYILTSVLRGLDEGIVQVVQDILEDRWTNQKKVLGSADYSMSISEMTYTKQMMSTDELDTLADIRQKIIDGVIVVPSAIKYDL